VAKKKRKRKKDLQNRPSLIEIESISSSTVNPNYPAALLPGPSSQDAAFIEVLVGAGESNTMIFQKQTDSLRSRNW
jgi:hypothetical protein